MKIVKIVVGGLETNCYLVYDEKLQETTIVDPGDDPELIMNRVRDLELIPTQIVATHGHFDHLLAVNELKLAYKIPFLLPKGDEVMLRWMRKSTKYFLGEDPGPAPVVDRYIGKGEEFKMGGSKFKVISTPGHTPGGVCLYSENENVLFSGDTIFAEGAVGRTDFPYCNHADLVKSVKTLMKLPKKTIVYPGHGEETTIERERLLHLMQK